MRIIAGISKGRTLKTPKWEGLRPTSDKLRETLFNILAPRIEGARVLDVFAGTGAVALEDAVRDAGTQRAAGGIVVLEHAARVAPPAPAGLVLARTVKSGDSALTFYS